MEILLKLSLTAVVEGIVIKGEEFFQNFSHSLTIDLPYFLFGGEELEDQPTDDPKDVIFLKDLLADCGSLCIILPNGDISSVLVSAEVINQIE